MPEAEQNVTATEASESEDDKYLLKGRDDIVHTLLEVSKKPDIISAYFDQGRETLITTVITVIQERGLVLLEFGPSKKKNKQLLEHGRMNCVTKHDSIDIRFRLTELRMARYRGQPVIAAPLPESVLRLQRREYFRVHTPLIDPLICRTRDNEGGLLELPLVDISIGGLCLMDDQHALQPDPRTILEGCTLIFPHKAGEIDVDLEVRSILMQGKEDALQFQRIGCAFVDMSNHNSNFIQRYINRLQLQQKRLMPED
jgi:c-di-GMP-binding flagellar brake protein YcgR